MKSSTADGQQAGMPAPQFVKPRGFTNPQSRGELPHLFIEAGTYFVTFRLLDAVIPKQIPVVQASSLPSARQTEITESQEDESLLIEAVQHACEPPLQLGSCVLGQPKVAEIIARALLHFNLDRYTLHAWCVMPNHVHVVVTPHGSHNLSEITHSWKSFTANQINRLLGRSGVLWERESFDHWIRSEESFERFVSYTQENPIMAGLCRRKEDWRFSS